jgi:hypothetical protein
LPHRDRNVYKALRRWTARRLNNALARGGLRLDYRQNDFDDRPLDDFTRRKLFSAMAQAFDNWNTHQQIFDVIDVFDTAAATEAFFSEWVATPFREQHGGSRFNNLLWLFLIAKSYRPSLIVDSGTFQGASAWALSRGSPDARVFSYDVDLSQLRARYPTITYVGSDWMQSPPEVLEGDRFLAYFDDHVDQIRRLLEAAERSCSVVIFDDDYPVTAFFDTATSPSVLPKIEFALDNDLQNGQMLEWLSRGVKQRWNVDREYLNRGLSKIAATERLPNTSLITGIHQTPYRIISVQSNGD